MDRTAARSAVWAEVWRVLAVHRQGADGTCVRCGRWPCRQRDFATDRLRETALT